MSRTAGNDASSFFTLNMPTLSCHGSICDPLPDLQEAPQFLALFEQDSAGYATLVNKLLSESEDFAASLIGHTRYA